MEIKATTRQFFCKTIPEKSEFPGTDKKIGLIGLIGPIGLIRDSSSKNV